MIITENKVLKMALKNQPWSEFSYEFKFLDSNFQVHLTTSNSIDPQT